uniref:Uncharacterized protein n=1 Tax=Sus scrofa TaxID=9823 RepID=A0A4X1TR89_PIG
MPFKSVKCRLCYHQDTMLLPQSKRRLLWSVSTTNRYKKEIFLFSKRVLPNSFPTAAWVVGGVSFPLGVEHRSSESAVLTLLLCCLST